MPRSYNKDNNGSYNWYAATAESGTYTMNSGNASDSICPAGWQLPMYGSATVNKTWSKLLTNGYGITMGGDIDDSAILNSLHQSALSITTLGFYDGIGVNRMAYTRTAGFYWTAYPTSVNPPGRATHLDLVGKYLSMGNRPKGVYGLSVRCVNR